MKIKKTEVEVVTLKKKVMKMGQSVCRNWFSYRFSKPVIAILMTLNIWITCKLCGWTDHDYSSYNHAQLQNATNATQTNISKLNTNASYYNYRQNLEIPALVILGPAKAGTRSFIDAIASFDDIIQYESERHFWSGSTDFVCQPWYNKQEWQWFIQ